MHKFLRVRLHGRGPAHRRGTAWNSSTLFFVDARRPGSPDSLPPVAEKLQEYIEELDFPHSLYEAVMAVPPETLSVLAPADLKRFYLEGMSPSTQDDVDAASARALGISVLEYFERKVAGNGSAADNPGRQQKDQTAPGIRAASSVAGQKRPDTQGSDAPRNATGS